MGLIGEIHSDGSLDWESSSIYVFMIFVCAVYNTLSEINLNHT